MEIVIQFIIVISVTVCVFWFLERQKRIWYNKHTY
jgi:hypothetical protein